MHKRREVERRAVLRCVRLCGLEEDGGVGRRRGVLRADRCPQHRAHGLEALRNTPFIIGVAALAGRSKGLVQRIHLPWAEVWEGRQTPLERGDPIRVRDRRWVANVSVEPVGDGTDNELVVLRRGELCRDDVLEEPREGTVDVNGTVVAPRDTVVLKHSVGYLFNDICRDGRSFELNASEVHIPPNRTQRGVAGWCGQVVVVGHVHAPQRGVLLRYGEREHTGVVAQPNVAKHEPLQQDRLADGLKQRVGPCGSKVRVANVEFEQRATCAGEGGEEGDDQCVGLCIDRSGVVEVNVVQGERAEVVPIIIIVLVFTFFDCQGRQRFDRD
eukprot:PhM_4_TR10181/c0_g1_i2/m.82236